MRQRLLPVLVSVATAAALLGTATSAEPAKPRFTIDSARDGFTRLDTQTGAVTHCGAIKGKWTCDAILSGDAILVSRVEALAVEVARLSANTAMLAARIERLAKNGPAALAPGGTVQPTAAAAPQQVARKGLADRIVNRFLAMVRLLKHGKSEATSATTPS